MSGEEIAHMQHRKFGFVGIAFRSVLLLTGNIKSVLFLLTTLATVSAATITLNDEGYVTAIRDLTVGDKTYNVAFFVTANPYYGQNPPADNGITTFRRN